MKIKKGDLVFVDKGKSRSKTGKVLRIIPKENRIVVEGLNMAKKHARPRRQGEKGQIIDIPRPMSLSNVRLVCPACGQPTRVGYQIGQDKKKTRLCKKCHQAIK
ncbi:MAG: 50S ribosomal protein L24 [Patescibacteria group bacterium]|nr:50S ribosomal protein L24 [Patescibacteria group bacterium]MCL5257926.1 50S ribosomal protein L24 [Patescibacteria group bacterium]